MREKIETVIKEATKDLIGQKVDPDILVERLTKVFMELIPKRELEEVSVSTEDGRKYEFTIPLDTSCMRCGCPVREPHPKQWGRFICAECGEFVHG